MPDPKPVEERTPDVDQELIAEVKRLRTKLERVGAVGQELWWVTHHRDPEGRIEKARAAWAAVYPAEFVTKPLLQVPCKACGGTGLRPIPLIPDVSKVCDGCKGAGVHLLAGKRFMVFECPDCGWAATTGAPGAPCPYCKSQTPSRAVEVAVLEDAKDVVG